MTDNQGLMRCKDVVELTKLGTGTIYRLMDLGSFPRPVRVTEYAVRWKRADVLDWVNSRPESNQVTAS